MPQAAHPASRVVRSPLDFLGTALALLERFELSTMPKKLLVPITPLTKKCCGGFGKLLLTICLDLLHEDQRVPRSCWFSGPEPTTYTWPVSLLRRQLLRHGAETEEQADEYGRREHQHHRPVRERRASRRR